MLWIAGVCCSHGLWSHLQCLEHGLHAGKGLVFIQVTAPLNLIYPTSQCWAEEEMCAQISLETGGQLDTDLHGQVCSSAHKQRIYNVIDDTEYLWQVPCLASCWVCLHQHHPMLLDA